jgi:hypothetical protein
MRRHVGVIGNIAVALQPERNVREVAIDLWSRANTTGTGSPRSLSGIEQG